MHVVLWDTRKRDVAKDFAGGFGVGQYHGRGGFRGRIIRRAYKRDRRPVALNFAYLAAIFKQLGHTVAYSEDRLPRGGDLYVFNPSLITLDLERKAINEVLSRQPESRVLVAGLVAYALPEAFDMPGVTIVRGEPEQLLWKLDDVLASDRPIVDVGSVEDLDSLPLPDWSLFRPRRFRIGYDFWKFPTGLIQQSRGCTFQCNYCPYIVVENKTRFRSPECIVEEMRRGIERYGFRSFKFRDPLFGLDRRRALQLAELIEKLPRKVQFSIESRIDLLRPETLRALKRAGLSSITVGIETPDDDTLRNYKRAPIKDDRQKQFVALCRQMGVRTVAGFMIGFPEDTVESIRNVLRYAKDLNPTFANFNIVTPYPGTEFFNQVKRQVADFDFTKYDVYTPVMRYQHLSAEQIAELHAKCFVRYYFRWRYLRENAHLLWPLLGKLGIGAGRVAHIPQETAAASPVPPAHDAVPKPLGEPLSIVQDKDLRHDGPHQPNKSGSTAARRASR